MDYYNEFDPKAAAWLRDLIAQGLIPEGDVDERSIVDVRGHELTRYRRCHFFAGVGGWAEALRLAGWPEDRPVWTGSCPCQPFSIAGKKKGVADKRHLWPDFRRLISECQPAIIFGEQVASKAGRGWLAGVRTDLEALAYAVGASDLCAAGAGAPHIRQRLWWGAAADGVADTRGRRRQQCDAGIGAIQQSDADGDIRGMAQPDGGEPGDGRLQRGREHGQLAPDSGAVRLADTEGGGCGIVGDAALAGGGRHLDGGGVSERLGDTDLPGSQRRREHDGEHPGERAAREASPAGGLAHAERPERGPLDRVRDDAGRDLVLQGQEGAGQSAGAGASGRLADTEHDGRRTDQQGWRPQGRTPDRGARFWDTFAIVNCTDGKARRFESCSFPLAHGAPARVGRLRGYGNAIVPQVAAEFIGAFMESL